MTACAKCGAIISRFATVGDRYCWPCHPRVEASAGRCQRGHDLAIHGAITASGAHRATPRCMACKRERDRLRAQQRRANVRGNQ